jgi:hypothetical protein
MARFRSARRICPAPEWGRLAQLVEQLTLNQRVVGSNPSASTILLKDLMRNIDPFTRVVESHVIAT